MPTMREDLRTYDEWRRLLDAELGVMVVDDEGRRRCAQDRRLRKRISRGQAESYYTWNSFVRRRAEASQPS
jgi:hypothetical protein